jgi:SAM-dependent methyltransferase
MLAEGKARAEAAGISNVDWQQADAATATLSGFDLLTSAFGLMFFGDPVAAFAHMRRAANTGARMAFVCWRQLDENPWIQVPMNAVARHLPPRPKPVPNAPGMFAFADQRRVSEVLTEAGSVQGGRRTESNCPDLRIQRAAIACGGTIAHGRSGHAIPSSFSACFRSDEGRYGAGGRRGGWGGVCRLVSSLSPA